MLGSTSVMRSGATERPGLAVGVRVRGGGGFDT